MVKDFSVTLPFDTGEQQLPTPQAQCLLFVSFDISGNTAYKQTNPSTQDGGWYQDVSKIFDDLIAKLAAAEANFQFWKFLGDELILKISVQTLPDVSSALESIDAILREISLKIWHQTKQRLDMKATVWLAAIDDLLNKVFTIDIATLDKQGKQESEQENIQDYVGASIDEGFRIAHAIARSKRVAISFDIAYLFAKENLHDEFSRAYHVGFAELKGIWNQKPYPAIWYSTAFQQDNEETPYYHTNSAAESNHHCSFTERFSTLPALDAASENAPAHIATLKTHLDNIYRHIPQAREHHDALRSVLGLKALPTIFP
jgi:hypothetical protein